MLYAWVGLAIVVMCTIQEVYHHATFGMALLECIWLTIYLTLVNYVLFEYTVPRLRVRKFYIGILLFVLYIFLFTALFHHWAQLGHLLHLNDDYIDPPGKHHDLGEEASFSIPSAFIFGIVSHLYKHAQLRQTAQQLRIEKQTAELNYLKSQTNPHFLFNTLNNIYSLARDKSDQAPETILRLSKILRYMLYEAGGSFVAVEQELKVIGDYISLEKLRYDESLRINFNYDVEDMKQAVPPLLLMPMVENAFKHGASETRIHPFVDIHLSIAQRKLAFYVRNSTEEHNGNGQVRENIGLSNLRRQLELLYTDYEVSVEQKQSEFSATLKINLASHV
ncbi:histidine kinase [Dinghuibacter silviterrae]|uniref:Histidine kinase n=2 Tax=Dinghuibacter silviterrae TaxID=1539049 RepID=A0A4R8DF88_9BACT|nr:histidine kinase [Dinghuibacter silviterrae]